MTYQLNEAKMFADISEDLAIVINSETGVYYGMNPFTSNLFENLVKGVPTEEIVSEILSMEGAPESFTDDLSSLVEGFKAKELILDGPQTGAHPSINRNAAVGCGFSISWDEFKDAQELLLADPIHEVREEQGWTPELSSLNPDAADVARREAKME